MGVGYHQPSLHKPPHRRAGVQAEIPDGQIPFILHCDGLDTHLLLEKAKAGSLQQLVTLADSVEAPVAAGSQLGTLTITSGEEVVAELPILAGEEIPRVTFSQMLVQMLRTAFLCG